MKNYILSYNQINEFTELEDLSFEEVGQLSELGLLDNDLIKIYHYVKDENIKNLNLILSKLKKLPNWLTNVAILDIRFSDIEMISGFLEINNSLIAAHSKLKEFTQSKFNGSVLIDDTNITKLPNHLIVHGYLSVEGIQFEEIPIDIQVSDNIYIKNSNLEQFSDAELRKMYKLSSGIIRV